MTDTRTTKVLVDLRHLAARVRARSAATGRTVSGLLRDALERLLDLEERRERIRALREGRE